MSKSKKKEETKAIPQEPIPTEKKWVAQAPISITFPMVAKESDKERVVQKVLDALQIVSKFQITKLGEPFFQEQGE